ncbi:MAG: hypothetical protein ABJB76_03185 [Candidatus Nitrosocosmicus sp.]
MSKLNLIAIVTIIAAVSLIVGMAAPAFAQGNTSSMTGGNMSSMGMNNASMSNSSMPMSSSNSSMMNGTK